MPAQVKVTLSEKAKKRLISNTRCRTTPIRLVARSKIVLLASQGQPNYKIVQELSIEVNKVSRWRNRFVENGFAGLEKDWPRGANHGGKNSEEQAKLRSKVITHPGGPPPFRGGLRAPPVAGHDPPGFRLSGQHAPDAAGAGQAAVAVPAG